jgi:hypothetical protein
MHYRSPRYVEGAIRPLRTYSIQTGEPAFAQLERREKSHQIRLLLRRQTDLEPLVVEVDQLR